MTQIDPHQGPLDSLLRRALVFNHIYEALVVTAEDDTILDWNAGAERTFGWTRDEVFGQPLQSVHRPMAAGPSGGTLEAIVQRVGRWQGQVQFLRKDGGTSICDVVGIPLVDAEGNQRGTLFVHAEVAAAETNESNEPCPRRRNDFLSGHHRAFQRRALPASQADRRGARSDLLQGP